MGTARPSGSIRPRPSPDRRAVLMLGPVPGWAEQKKPGHGPVFAPGAGSATAKDRGVARGPVSGTPGSVHGIWNRCRASVGGRGRPLGRAAGSPESRVRTPGSRVRWWSGRVRWWGRGDRSCRAGNPTWGSGIPSWGEGGRSGPAARPPCPGRELACPRAGGTIIYARGTVMGGPTAMACGRGPFFRRRGRVGRPGGSKDRGSRGLERGGFRSRRAGFAWVGPSRGPVRPTSRGPSSFGLSSCWAGPTCGGRASGPGHRGQGGVAGPRPDRRRCLPI